MLSINDLKLGTAITYKENPYIVIKSEHHKMGRGGAVLKTKLKNLLNHQTLEVTFQSSDKIEEADIERSKASYLYAEGDNYHFMDSTTFEQFFLTADTIGDQRKYLKEGLAVDILKYQGKPVTITLPIKIAYHVKEAPPGVKGDTAGTATKQTTLENGLTISTPLFINTGDIILVNTETGEYVERVS